ncbi:MAG: hypothetical protein ACI9LT_000592 [Pseudoalteromonas distincta]|jgi:hypothetical protein
MISSRALLVLATSLSLASAAAASAQTVVQDRYGPPPAAAAHQAQQGASTYGGQMLGWAGKRNPAPAQAAPAAPARPEPMALARQFAPQAAAIAPPVPRPAPGVQPGYEPVLRAALPPAADPPPDLLGGPPAGPLPTSIYGQAAASPQAPAPPRTYAQASAAPRPGGSQLYSLHREYGLTPDAIPAPPAGDNYILVGPPDTPVTPGDGEDPAQGLDRQF